MKFLILDVFAEDKYAGNQLAVVFDAGSLSSQAMQTIAREFNFSETTFVLPSSAADRRVRIFTPAAEIPFAGHPNIGTAFVLASQGELGKLDARRHATRGFVVTAAPFSEGAHPTRPAPVARAGRDRVTNSRLRMEDSCAMGAILARGAS